MSSYKSHKIQRIMENKKAQSEIEKKQKSQPIKPIIVTPKIVKPEKIEIKKVDKYNKHIVDDLYSAYTIDATTITNLKQNPDPDGNFM